MSEALFAVLGLAIGGLCGRLIPTWRDRSAGTHASQSSQHQFAIVREAQLAPLPILSTEDSKALKLLEHFMKGEGYGDCRVLAHVPLRALMTASQSGSRPADRSRRAERWLAQNCLDFVVVSADGSALVACDAVEPDAPADPSQAAKALAFKKAGIGYVEIYPCDLVNPTGLFDRLENALRGESVTEETAGIAQRNSIRGTAAKVSPEGSGV